MSQKAAADTHVSSTFLIMMLRVFLYRTVPASIRENPSCTDHVHRANGHPCCIGVYYSIDRARGLGRGRGMKHGRDGIVIEIARSLYVDEAWRSIVPSLITVAW